LTSFNEELEFQRMMHEEYSDLDDNSVDDKEIEEIMNEEVDYN